MDREDQGREFCEKFKNLAPESEPDGYKAIKRTLVDPLVHHVTQPPFPPLGRFCHETRGFAVLIINSEFDSQSKRRSAVNDEHYMNKMFEELNFDVHVLRNLSSKELEDKMKAIRDYVTAESDCFACVISSHGMEGQVRTSTPGVREPFIRTEHSINTRDGVVSTNKLLELFSDRNCRPLKGKPKMFFIQACRGRIDVERSDEIDMGVEVLLVETPASTTSRGSSARFFTRGDMALTSSSNTGDMATTSPVNTEDVVPTNSITMGDVVAKYDDYSDRRRDDFNEQRRYQVNVHASLQRQEPACTSTYTFEPTQPEPEPIEVFQIPCYNDYLVMFSSAAGTTAWSDSDKGGWLMHCLYQVFNDVTYTDDDLLTILTCVCGKMARDMETNCPNSPHYDKAKSAACVYHRLSKDIYLQPKEIKRERKR
nr:caspase-1 [Crassostrea gigas]